MGISERIAGRPNTPKWSEADCQVDRYAHLYIPDSGHGAPVQSVGPAEKQRNHELRETFQSFEILQESWNH